MFVFISLLWASTYLLLIAGTEETVSKGENSSLALGLFHKFHKPPWGGGNQFLIALARELRKKSIVVHQLSKPREDINLYLANAITFRFEELLKQEGSQKNRIVHRVDGPYYSARYGKDPRVSARDPWRSSEDEKVWHINNKLACATIFQSKWSYDMNILLGYKPKEPSYIIPNSVDADIFNSKNRTVWEPYPKRKTKLISSAWANNQRKGYKTHDWLDKHLDFDRFEYTFIGNVFKDSRFSNVHIMEPLGSEELGILLKSYDIYIAASYLEPCSNALIEALVSGLPVIYQRGSGHDDLVGEAGLGYNSSDEIPGLLNKVTNDYKFYQSRIKVETMASISERYLAVFDRCSG